MFSVTLGLLWISGEYDGNKSWTRFINVVLIHQVFLIWRWLCLVSDHYLNHWKLLSRCRHGTLISERTESNSIVRKHGLGENSIWNQLFPMWRRLKMLLAHVYLFGYHFPQIRHVNINISHLNDIGGSNVK